MRKIDVKDPFSLQFSSNFSSGFKRYERPDLKRIASGMTLPSTPWYSRKSIESKENLCETRLKGKKTDPNLASISPTPRSKQSFLSGHSEIKEVPKKRMPLMNKTIEKKKINNERSLVNIEFKSTVDKSLVYFRVEDHKLFSGIDFSKRINKLPFDNDCPTEEWQIDLTVEMFKKEILECLEDMQDNNT